MIIKLTIIFDYVYYFCYLCISCYYKFQQLFYKIPCIIYLFIYYVNNIDDLDR